MNSNIEEYSEKKKTLYFYIHLFFAFTGFILYIAAFQFLDYILNIYHS